MLLLLMACHKPSPPHPVPERPARWAPLLLPEQAGSLRFVVLGDLGGQGFCRNEHGYSIFHAALATAPDLAVFNGDTIYADSTCPDSALAAVHELDWTDRGALAEAFDAHWRYNLDAEAVRSFTEQVPALVQWDDHEVINDFGAEWDHFPMFPDKPGYRNLVEEGRDAFVRWTPAEFPLHRAVAWGELTEFFLLDARSYRSLNSAEDGPDKTLLGAEQQDWLVEAVGNSEATWKVVSSDVPLSIPTGWQSETYGADGWTGFEHELLGILRQLDEADVDNLVFVTTDVHWPSSMRYEVDADGDGDTLVFHEFVVGPLRAVTLEPVELDPTLSPQRLYAEGGVENFGLFEVSATSFTASVLDRHGVERPGSRIELRARVLAED